MVLRPGLRRPALLPARLFRLQARPAVRLFGLLARRRRPAAAMLPVVQHPERAPKAPRAGGAGAAGFGHFIGPSPTPCIPAPARTPATMPTTPTSYPVALSRGHAAAGRHLCRSVRPRADDRAARAGGRRQRRHHLRGRRPARRHGRAQALLARQLPVRQGSRARRPRLQALPPDRARRRRRAAAADQQARSPPTRTTATSRSSSTKLGVEDFYDRMDDVLSPEPLDPVARDEGRHRLARGAGARCACSRSRTGAKFLAAAARRGQHAGRRRRSSRPTGAWEDFSTPSRDLRLLIAIDVVRALPGPRGAAGRALCDAGGQERRRGEGRAARTCSPPSWRRASSPIRARDGSQWTLTLKDVIDRMRRARDGVQSERLRRVALGRAGRQRGDVDLPAACTGGAAREDDEIPRLVPRTAPAAEGVIFA